MAKQTDAKRVEPQQASKYYQSGQSFLNVAHDLVTLAGEEESYGSAIALLAVHSAISHTDAVTIAYAGKKSTSGEHRDAVKLLRTVFSNRLPDRVEKDLLSILAAKDAVAYQGKYFPLNDAEALLAKAKSFAAWADQKYQERPT
ncbi:MAG: hypothetical protein ABIZ70_14435 [Gemmatimonadales bacterium]